MSAKKKETAKKETPANAAPEKKSPEKAGGAKKVNVHHLTRVEGHGNIVVEIDDSGTVQTVRWEVPEAPRFFEAMLMGRYFEDVHQITSRVCGICSIGHQLCSLQATEQALGIQCSEQTHMLRKLALHGENMQSHILHLGYLVLPDLMGVPSVIPLAGSHPEELKTAIELHRMSNEFSRVITGRTTHPQRLIPGGFGKWPTMDELRTLKGGLEASVPKLKAIAELFGALKDKLPDFKRPTEYIGLVSGAEYAMYWGAVGSTEDKRRPARFYKDMTREYSIPQSTAKWARNQQDSFMVGALARFNLNSDKLSPLAREVADSLGFKAPCNNPYYNNLAQLVETVHTVEDSICIIDELLVKGVRPEPVKRIEPCGGKGVGAVEVPRGLLYHAYEYDKEGRIVHADCVIPTNQNHANIQLDLEALVPTLKDLSEEEIELKTSMLVRAYDPCISCSTHLIDVSEGKRDETGRPDRGVRFVRT